MKTYGYMNVPQTHRFTAAIIKVNSPNVWDDVIELAFVNKEKNDYIAITRIPYDNIVYFEFGDQIKYAYSKKVAVVRFENIVSFDVAAERSSIEFQGQFNLEIAIPKPPANFNIAFDKLFANLTDL